MESSSPKKRLQVSKDGTDWYDLQYEHLVPGWNTVREVVTINGLDYVNQTVRFNELPLPNA